jgi:carbonic anhydrase/acetyltransferase-like protein (isoleucine patch superfamily)
MLTGYAMKHRNTVTDFSPSAVDPTVDATAFIHPLAAVIGNVTIGKKVMVSPFASIRGDEGQPLFIGDHSNVQDGVIIHALETEIDGKVVEKNCVTVQGKQYAVYVDEKVSLAHQVQIHGPAFVGNNTFVGMKSLVFKSQIAPRCVIEPGCIIMGVTVAEGRYVPAGTVWKTQKDADALPLINEQYPMKDMNKGVIHVNVALAEGYNRDGMQ